MANSGLVLQDLAQEAFTDAFRRHVGRGKALSCEQVSEKSGVPLRTVRSYHGGQATPGLAGLLSLLSVLPPSFANELLALAGLGGAAANSARAADSYVLNASLTDFAAQIGAHLKDGRIDHRELREELEKAKEVSDVLLGFIRAAEGAKG